MHISDQKTGHKWHKLLGGKNKKNKKLIKYYANNKQQKATAGKITLSVKFITTDTRNILYCLSGMFSFSYMTEICISDQNTECILL